MSETGGLRMGVFVEADSPLHRMGARTKLACVVVLSLLIFLAPWPWFPSVVALGAVWALAVVSGGMASARRAARPLVALLILAVIMRAFDPSILQIPGGGAGFVGPMSVLPAALSHLPFSLAGGLEGLQQGLRIIAVAFIASLLSATTAPGRLMDAMAYFLRPLAIIGVPVDRAARIGGMALCAMPALWEMLSRRFHDARSETQTRTHDSASVGVLGRLASRLSRYVDAMVLSFVDAISQARVLCEPTVASDSLKARNT